MSKVYDRKSGCISEDEQFGQKELEFLYKSRAGRILLNLLVKSRLFSKLYTRRYYSRASAANIAEFISKYEVDTGDYEPCEYLCFNDFFVRKPLPCARPLPDIDEILFSPADAKLTCYEIAANSEIMIKGSKYSVGELIGDRRQAEAYKSGACLVFRLTVDDCHRYSFIDDGVIVRTKEIKGCLHTVSDISQGYKVLEKNNRVVSHLCTRMFGDVIFIEIGAMLVGRIHNHKVESFSRGQEKGFFSFGGSTIVLLFKKAAIKIDDDILAHSKSGVEVRVKLGESIGKALIV